MRPKILFVDDERDLLESIEDALYKLPYDLVFANSGEEALALLEATAIDVVVSDERMPEMNGHELLTRVCRDYPDVVRILLTGQASMEATILAINEGQIYRFLCKPCNADDLTRVLEEAMELRATVRDGAASLGGARARQKALKCLEEEHPGISAVERNSDGYVVVSETPSDIAALLAEMGGLHGTA